MFGKLLILCTSCWISTSRYSKKYLKYSSIRMRSNHSKMFIYLKSLEIFCEEVNSYWSCEMKLGTLQKKLFHASFFVYFAFIFSEGIIITFSEETLRVYEHNFFQKYKRKVTSLVIYQFNYDWSKSPLLMFNMAFDVVLSTVFVKSIRILCFLQY